MAILIGGTSLPECLDEATAAELAGNLVAHAERTGSTLLVSTSPRTDNGAAAAIVRLIHPPHIVHLWHGKGDNPYRRFLTLADEIVVTSDSVSMVVDALATGKPVAVYRIKHRRSLVHRLVEALHDRAWSKPVCPAWMRPVKWLFDKGIIEVPADRRLLFDRLAAEGRLAWFDGQIQLSPQTRPAPDDTSTAIMAVRKLFSKPA
jgi:hypothetical protein